MALPICIHIPPLPEAPTLTLPGGATLQHHQLLQAVQPALAPLTPLFDIIGAVLALGEVVKAIPDALGPPPDPTAIAAALPKLAEKVSKLLRLVPQLSVPYTAVGVIDIVLGELGRARGQLMHLQLRLSSVAQARLRAAQLGDAGLLAVAGCAEANVAQEAANVGKALAALSQLMALLNVLLGLVGGPQVPDFSSLEGSALEEAIAPLDAIVRTLQQVRAAIPIP
ncbi:hypothetical protein [Myxococcus qinghaiensis]|uniref:hypothetical protein n=1 Tax=Myxococcus qinghaiensis TaxID=2906758 RepID=UPI0020A81DC1|nr:hypothetical protein [Myxococcus qinghaiensis]MCP3163165.1 hypothetical protein [Myxococcus qinghaiensis]